MLQAVLLHCVRLFCNQVRNNADIFTIIMQDLQFTTKLQQFTDAYNAILQNIAQNNTKDIGTQIGNWVKKCIVADLKNNTNFTHKSYQQCKDLDIDEKEKNMFKMASDILKAAEPVCNKLADELLVSFTASTSAAFATNPDIYVDLAQVNLQIKTAMYTIHDEFTKK